MVSIFSATDSVLQTTHTHTHTIEHMILAALITLMNIQYIIRYSAKKKNTKFKKDDRPLMNTLSFYKYNRQRREPRKPLPNAR